MDAKIEIEAVEKAKLFDEIEKRGLLVNCHDKRCCVFSHTVAPVIGESLLEVMRKVCAA